MNTTEITINDVSYNDLTVAYAWLIEQTAGKMLDAGHPAQPLALAIEAEIVKRHNASVDFMQAKEEETVCLDDECCGTPAPESIVFERAHFTGTSVASCTACSFQAVAWQCGCELAHDCEGVAQ
jgi:hypothetical protein